MPFKVADLLNILISNFYNFWPKIFAPVWLGNRLIYAGLEPVLSHTIKSCIASYYSKFSTNIKIKS